MPDEALFIADDAAWSLLYYWGKFIFIYMLHIAMHVCCTPYASYRIQYMWHMTHPVHPITDIIWRQGDLGWWVNPSNPNFHGAKPFWSQ